MPGLLAFLKRTISGKPASGQAHPKYQNPQAASVVIASEIAESFSSVAISISQASKISSSSDSSDTLASSGSLTSASSGSLSTTSDSAASSNSNAEMLALIKARAAARTRMSSHKAHQEIREYLTNLKSNLAIAKEVLSSAEQIYSELVKPAPQSFKEKQQKKPIKTFMESEGSLLQSFANQLSPHISELTAINNELEASYSKYSDTMQYPACRGLSDELKQAYTEFQACFQKLVCMHDEVQQQLQMHVEQIAARVCAAKQAAQEAQIREQELARIRAQTEARRARVMSSRSVAGLSGSFKATYAAARALVDKSIFDDLLDDDSSTIASSRGRSTSRF